MTTPWIGEDQVRAFLVVSGTEGAFSPGMLGSNAALACELIEMETHRLFNPSTGSKTFTTRNRRSMAIPDLRSATSVTLNGSPLTASSSYYLIPDRMNSGVYLRIELPTNSSRSDYRSYPGWFDQNLDQEMYRSQLAQGLPNDLVIDGGWGHIPIPSSIQSASAILAAWLSRRIVALLANALILPGGDTLDYSSWPVEVRTVVDRWRIAESYVESVG